MKRIYFWIGVAVSAVFLWWALRGLELSEVWHDLQSANYWWLLPGVAVYFVAVWARTWRWDYMLRPLKHIPLARLFPVVVIGYMGNNIYPFRAGEVLRSYVLRQREEVPMGASLATVIVERVFDGLVMLVFVFFALPFHPHPRRRWLYSRHCHYRQHPLFCGHGYLFWPGSYARPLFCSGGMVS